VKAFGELGQFELAPDAAGRPDEHRHIVVAWRGQPASPPATGSTVPVM
jgi:hypothetical protein